MLIAILTALEPIEHNHRYRLQSMTSNCHIPNCHTFYQIGTLFSKLSHFFPNCHTFCLFCFIIVQKQYLLGECSQIVTLFTVILGKNCDNLRLWTVAYISLQAITYSICYSQQRSLCSIGYNLQHIPASAGHNQGAMVRCGVKDPRLTFFVKNLLKVQFFVKHRIFVKNIILLSKIVFFCPKF